jgi:hypothetical protein
MLTKSTIKHYKHNTVHSLIQAKTIWLITHFTTVLKLYFIFGKPQVWFWDHRLIVLTKVPSSKCWDGTTNSPWLLPSTFPPIHHSCSSSHSLLYNLYNLECNSPEDGDSMFLWNVGTYLQVHVALQPRRPTTIFSPPWEPQIS